jgi:RNA polymerase sigma factor (sigma-70 family)
MRSRDTNLDQFSTFAFLEGDRVRHWLPEPRLRRNMRKYLTDAEAPNEGVSDLTWAIYWYKIWQVQQEAPPEPRPNIATAQQHLAAYLQEVCYWTAQKTALRFPQLEFTLADYFQINSGETARVLKSFNPQFGSPLKGYASIVLTNLLKDHLRQRRAIDVCSDVSLLRKMSHKRITEILTVSGVTANDLEEYRFAWVCFKTIVVPGDGPVSETDKGQPSDKRLWTAVADLYNSKRHHSLSAATPQMTAEQLETRLMKITRWSRAYLYPTVDSLNKTKPGQEKGEIQDSIADPLATSLLDAAIEAETIQERQEQRSQLQTTLTQSLNQLDGMSQEILRLFYQDRLSQQELALNMKMSQPTISRRLKKAEETLLTKLLGSVNKYPEPSELRHISIALKECLESHYR